MRHSDRKTADTLHDWANKLVEAGYKLREVAFEIDQGYRTKDQEYKNVLDALSVASSIQEEAKKLS